MKYAIIFAATAAAHQAYGGYGYAGEAHSSAPVKPSTTSKPAGYATITPGYGKQPVTVTTQNQAYPTCVSAAYGGKSCDKWEENTYVSTVIKDYDNNYATVTCTDDKVVVYHTKTTITHSATATGGYAQPTGVSSKNGTDNCWYELYEKIEEVPYKELGPNALHGYPGSGLYPQGSKEQPVHVKEYKGGKWAEYEHTYSYGTPKPEVKVYEKPGVYVVPSKDMVVEYPVDHPAEATTTAKAGETCTYGGQYVEATSTGYITAPYGAYKTKTEGGKTVTETVVSYTTIYASTTGHYEVAKPTTTVYDHDVEVTYPTAKHYDAGVYHQPAQTVTITSAGQAYTCEYEKPTATPSAAHGYGYNKPSPSPLSPNGGNKYPSYSAQPAKNSTYPASSSPAAYHGYPASSSPAAYHGYPASSSPAAYNAYPASSSPAAYGHGYAASTMMTKYATSSTPAAYSVASPSSTPCESSSTPAAYQTQPAKSTPAAYNSYPAASSPAVEHGYAPVPASSAVYNAYPAASSPAVEHGYAPVPAASSPAAYQPAPAASSPAAYNNYPAASTTPAAYQATPTPSSNAYKPTNEYGGAEGNTYSDEGNSYGSTEDEAYGAEQESYGAEY
ncbi:hypothetical protein yc1106_04793 [Curvularia clavata]|uniref:Uncharacterized protein n=1 Tax=Curvularia clavata TaxID=95742 RepID=A0A9Q8Z7N3_CURCL|nr:hypothetical protein yc1106_04793 [Curvularia clavata]